ncbi:MAG: CcmD family protein [Chloroflexaceae bacterium]|nr:CcmD family protein [Chloroflexaceae bacterium]
MNETETALYIAMAVALIVWLGLFVYLWRLDGQARDLRRRLERYEHQPQHEPRPAPTATLERRTPSSQPPSAERSPATAATGDQQPSAGES